MVQMTESSAPTVLEQPIRFGAYYLLEKVASGGMAEVYRAKSFGVEGFERLVAVKTILPSIAANTEFIRMFVDEAKLAGQLSHSNIAQIFDLGRVDDTYFIAMEFVSGHDLKMIWERLRASDKRLPIDLACYVLTRVCEGLEHAHNKTDPMGTPLHIVHRDVSPQNVIISYEGEVKVIDFGVAKAASSSTETRVGILKGKLSYMSPEQVRGLSLDRRSDTFAAGIVLYEMLTGERLFLGDTDFETLEKIRKVEVAPPSLYNRAVPRELEDIVLTALQKNPNQRYQSAHELQQALQKFMYGADMHVSQRDVSAWMAATFADDLATERVRLERFQALRPDALEPAAASLAWDDDESETQVFSRDQAADAKADLVLDSFVPPKDDIVWARPRTDEERTAIVDTQSDGAAASGMGSTLRGMAPMPESDVPAARPTSPTPARDASKRAAAASSAPQVVAPTAPVPGPDATTREPAHVTAPVPRATERRGGGGVWIAAIVLALLAGVLLFFVMRGTEAPEDAAADTSPSLTIPVASNPSGARVLVDGRAIGTTPTSIAGVEPGATLLVRIEADDHEPWERALSEVDADTSILAELVAVAPEPADPAREDEVVEAVAFALPVSSTPVGAAFTISDASGAVVARGVTPGVAEGLLPATEYVLALSLDGHTSIEMPWSSDGADVDGVEIAMQATAPEPEREAEPEPDREAAPAVAANPEADRESRQEREARQQREREEREARDRREREQREAAEREAAEQEAAAAAQAAAQAQPATLNIQSIPAARVVIDGNDTGQYTPIIGYSIPPGTYRVELINEQFGLHRAYRVSLEPGEARTILNRQE